MHAGNKVVVVGQGYVGLPLAVRAAEVGYDVVGFDLDTHRVEQLAAGTSYVTDVSDIELKEVLVSGQFVPSADIADCAGFAVAVIAVPTPLRDGVPDVSYIESAAELIGPLVTEGSVVVLESTTYPGTTEDLLVPILERASGLRCGPDFHVGFSPERIDPGNATYGFANTPKVVSGVDEASCAAVNAFYRSVVERTVPVSTPRAAELTKLLENTFRHVNIALVNELAVFAHEMGIDIWEVIGAASSKPFGFMPFYPGPGVGGHCLPIDPSYLSWQVRRQLGHSFRFVELANDVNEHMPDYVVRRVTLALNRRRLAVNGARIVQVGLAYKRNTADARESPAVHVAQRLLALGADLCVVDPLVGGEHAGVAAPFIAGTPEEFAEADLVLVLTDHDVVDWDAVSRAPHVFDTRHRLDGANVEHL